MAWPMPRVPPVITIVLLQTKQCHSRLPSYRFSPCSYEKLSPDTPRNYSPVTTDGSRETPLTGPIRQARVSGSYCLIIVAGDPKTTEETGIPPNTTELIPTTQLRPIVSSPLGHMI